MISTKELKSCKTKHKILVSVAIFKMKDSYRTFEKYIYQLDKLVKDIQKYAPFVNLRIYVDVSTQYLAEKYKEDFVEVVFYECEPFLTEDKKFHDGTFGSLVRFLPCFEHDKKYDYICISDIDVSVRMNIQKKYFDKMKEENAQISYHSTLCYKKPWIKIDYPIINLRFITSVRFPKKMLTDYLQDVVDKKYEKERFEILEYNLKSGKKFSEDTLFPYGFDELFTNGILSKHIFPRYKCLIYIFVTLGTVFKSCFHSTYKSNKKVEELVVKHWNTCEKIMWEEPVVPDKIMKLNYDLTMKLYNLMKDCAKIKVCIDDFLYTFKHSEKNSQYCIITHYPTKESDKKSHRKTLKNKSR
jgi:hypothetical protein